jgi:hypothetical protein
MIAFSSFFFSKCKIAKRRFYIDIYYIAYGQKGFTSSIINDLKFIKKSKNIPQLAAAVCFIASLFIATPVGIILKISTFMLMY